ncbi:MAG TPA: MFS transporter [Caulobacteraceae bacterium]|nr:MFS transporter [Caulobacteraceae bacterium]
MTAPQKGLWSHRDFLRLWAAQTVSSFGARIAREGLPWAAVITMKAGPEAMGIFAALALGPQAAVGPFAGHLVDRLPKKALMIAADLARMAILIVVPVTALVGRLTLTEIYVAGALMGVFNVLFDVADHAFLPSLVARSELLDGNAKLATTDAAAEVAGPAIAGSLVQLITAPFALAVCAFTYLASALCLAGIGRKEETARPEPAPFDLAAGLRIALGHPLVRPIWLGDVTRSFFGNFFAALYLLFATRDLHLTPALLGIAIAGGGVGGLAGAALAPRLAARLGVGPTIILPGLAGALTLWLIPLAGGPPLVALMFLLVPQVLGDGLQMAAEINATSLRQTVLPAAALGRAGGAFAFGAGLMGVAGALVGGFAGGLIGARWTLSVAAAGIAAASLFAMFSPLRTLRTAPPAEPLDR